VQRCFVCAAYVLAEAASLVRLRADSDRTGFLGGLGVDTEMTAFLARTTAVFADPSNFNNFLSRRLLTKLLGLGLYYTR